jgi:hypothetical protein
VRRARALAAWLTATCLLLGGVAPAVSQTLAAAAAIDLCVGGAPGAPRDGGSGDGRAHAADCAYCLPHGGSDAAPPPAPLAGAVTAAAARDAAAVAIGAPAAGRAWRPSAARAPPLPPA